MKDKQTQLSVNEIEEIIESKRNEIKTIRDDLKVMVSELALAKKERRDNEKKEKFKSIASNFDGLWKELAVLGFNYKEIVSLQNIDTKYSALGDILGVCAARARQIRKMAIRKTKYSRMREVVEKLGLSEVTDDLAPWDTPIYERAI